MSFALFKPSLIADAADAAATDLGKVLQNLSGEHVRPDEKAKALASERRHELQRDIARLNALRSLALKVSETASGAEPIFALGVEDHELLDRYL